MFKIEPLEFPSLKLTTIDGERRYVTPEGHSYLSVTKFLDRVTDKRKIREWKNRVGEQKANAKTNSAIYRGKEVHKLCESFLLNEEIKSTNPINLYSFRKAQPLIAKHVTLVRNCEQMVYSNSLKLAGTLDLLGEWDGTPAVIDFKTSAKVKSKKWIEHYFLQATAYTVMVFERTGHLPKRIVVVFIPQDDEPQFYVENPSNYLGKLLNLIQLDRAA